MKFKIHRNTKRVLLLIVVLLAGLSCLQLFLSLSFPQKVSAETIQYESVLTPKLSYEVFINPNEVYSGTTIGEDKMYSKKLLNNIRADFSLSYSGSKTVPLDIDYQIIATVNGYEGKDKGKVIYWSKNFPLTNKKTFQEENSSWSKNEKINFPLSNFDAFAVRAKDITGMDVSNELIVSMIGKVIAHTEIEDVETPFNISIQLPLMKDSFQILKSNMDPIKNNSTSLIERQAPINKFKIMSYGILLILSLISIIVLFFFTRQPNHDEMLLKKVNSTLKNYGSRIVALQNIPMMNYRQHYKVHSMKDMIKIADELQKPIFYEVDSATIVKDYEFHIIENDTIYSLFLDSAEA